MPVFSTTESVIAIALIAFLALGIAAVLMRRKRRTERLRSRFGGAEYARAIEKDGNRQNAESGLEKRTQRVQEFHVHPLAAGDRARFLESWHGVQSRFVDGPAGAVTEADQLLGDVMATRGYPMSEFEQRSADISVDHPLVLQNYRTAHDIALRQTRGQASTEDLRQAMVHYRTLFEELINEPAAPIPVAHRA
jgi:type II secretory pathway pseudopilin PulG